MSEITIYHNPECGTSRNTLALIRNSGVEPRVVLYLENPPSRVELSGLITRMGITARELLRTNTEPYEHLGLDNPAISDDELLDAMLAYPILINRPIPRCAGLRSGCWIFCRMRSVGSSPKRTGRR